MANGKTVKLTIIDEVKGERNGFQIVTQLFKGYERDVYETSVYPISVNNEVLYGNPVFFEQSLSLGDAFTCHLKTLGRYSHGTK